MRTMISIVVITLGLGGLAGCDPAEADIEVTPRDGEDDGPPVCDEAGRVYVSQDPGLCEQVRFICQADMTVFSDECGCGCEPLADEDAPSKDAVELAAHP